MKPKKRLRKRLIKKIAQMVSVFSLVIGSNYSGKNKSEKLHGPDFG
jgi:hypothetical protein